MSLASSSNSPFIIEVTLENFQQVILEGSQQQPVVVDFWADWCAPCKALMPILYKLAEEFQGQFILATINIEQQPELAQQFQVRSVPTVMLVSQGQLLDQFNSALPESEVRAFLKQHLTNPVEAVKEEIKQLIAAGALPQAQQLLVQAMQQLPEDTSLQIDLARVLLQQGLNADAQAVLEQLPEAEQASNEVKSLKAGLNFATQAPTPEELASLAERDDSEARYKKALAFLVASNYEAALGLLLNIMRDERDFQEGIAHKTLLEVFALLGEGNPLVVAARRKLYTLMY